MAHFVAVQKALNTGSYEPPELPTSWEILPSATVEVGEPIIFNASELGLSSDMYKWDFGDTYTYNNTASYYNSGNAVVHIFMTPGTKTVTLTVNSTVYTQDIVVTGEAPIAGFEVWMAPVHARISQYLYIQIPASVTASATNRLIVSIASTEGYSATLLTKTSLSSEEILEFNAGTLNAGHYTITFRLEQSDTTKISIVKEKFTKEYNGNPKVGINKDNAFVINGNLFFPLGTWQMHPTWRTPYVNRTNCYFNEGYSATHVLSDWENFIAAAEDNNVMFMGEDRWHGKGANGTSLRNSDMTILRDYINAAKDSDSLLIYCWEDEPNMGGWTGRVPPAVLAAWSEITHQIDRQHPTGINSYAYVYLPYYNGLMNSYNYLYSAPEFGGKKYWITDTFGGAVFVVEMWQLNLLQDPNDSSRGAFDVYCQGLDNMINWNYNLVPTMPFVGTTDTRLSLYWGAPTTAQVKMWTWLNVVHGAKGLTWYPYQGTTTAEVFAFMDDFKTIVDALTNVILAPDSDITISDSSSPTWRIDTMIRKYGGSTYLFAVRLTEMDEWEESDVTTTFTVSGVTVTTCEVYGESRTRTVASNIFTDDFAVGAVHIYKLD
jgi:hypothetical protein